MCTTDSEATESFDDDLLNIAGESTKEKKEIAIPEDSYFLTSYTPISETVIRKQNVNGVCGLTNFGNTCFLSAAVQALSHCDPFRNYILSVPFPFDEGSEIPFDKSKSTLLQMELATGSIPTFFFHKKSKIKMNDFEDIEQSNPGIAIFSQTNKYETNNQSLSPSCSRRSTSPSTQSEEMHSRSRSSSPSPVVSQSITSQSHRYTPQTTNALVSVQLRLLLFRMWKVNIAAAQRSSTGVSRGVSAASVVSRTSNNLNFIPPSVTPDDLYHTISSKAAQFGGHEQCDCQELLTFILGEMDTELTPHEDISNDEDDDGDDEGNLKRSQKKMKKRNKLQLAGKNHTQSSSVPEEAVTPQPKEATQTAFEEAKAEKDKKEEKMDENEAEDDSSSLAFISDDDAEDKSAGEDKADELDEGEAEKETAKPAVQRRRRRRMFGGRRRQDGRRKKNRQNKAPKEATAKPSAGQSSNSSSSGSGSGSGSGQGVLSEAVPELASSPSDGDSFDAPGSLRNSPSLPQRPSYLSRSPAPSGSPSGSRSQSPNASPVTMSPVTQSHSSASGDLSLTKCESLQALRGSKRQRALIYLMREEASLADEDLLLHSPVQTPQMKTTSMSYETAGNQNNKFVSAQQFSLNLQASSIFRTLEDTKPNQNTADNAKAKKSEANSEDLQSASPKKLLQALKKEPSPQIPLYRFLPSPCATHPALTAHSSSFTPPLSNDPAPPPLPLPLPPKASMVDLSAPLSQLRASQKPIPPSALRPSSIIRDVFSGFFTSSIRCLRCNRCSLTMDPFHDISLPIPEQSIRDELVLRYPQLFRSVMANFRLTHSNGDSNSTAPPPEQALPLSQKTSPPQSTLFPTSLLSRPANSLSPLPDNAISPVSSISPVASMQSGGSFNSNAAGSSSSSSSSLPSSLSSSGISSRSSSPSVTPLLHQNSLSPIQNGSGSNSSSSSSSSTSSSSSSAAAAVNLPSSPLLEECLCLFSLPEALAGDDTVKCQHCGAKGGEKRIGITTPPEILLINLKRLSFNSKSTKRYTTQTSKKINTHVHFPFILDLSPFLTNSSSPLSIFSTQTVSPPRRASPTPGTIPSSQSSPSPPSSSSSSDTFNRSPHKYSLVAVIIHDGNHENGHYTTVAFNSKWKKWFFFNDHNVTEIKDPADVLSKQAYILFYQRINPTLPERLRNIKLLKHITHIDRDVPQPSLSTLSLATAPQAMKTMANALLLQQQQQIESGNGVGELSGGKRKGEEEEEEEEEGKEDERGKGKGNEKERSAGQSLSEHSQMNQSKVINSKTQNNNNQKLYVNVNAASAKQPQLSSSLQRQSAEIKRADSASIKDEKQTKNSFAPKLEGDSLLLKAQPSNQTTLSSQNKVSSSNQLSSQSVQSKQERNSKLNGMEASSISTPHLSAFSPFHSPASNKQHAANENFSNSTFTSTQHSQTKTSSSSSIKSEASELSSKSDDLSTQQSLFTPSLVLSHDSIPVVTSDTIQDEHVTSQKKSDGSSSEPALPAKPDSTELLCVCEQKCSSDSEQPMEAEENNLQMKSIIQAVSPASGVAEPSTSSIPYLMTAEWMNRLKTMSNPGPFNNYPLLCPHGRPLPPSKRSVVVSEAFVIECLRSFGGGPIIPVPTTECTMCKLNILKSNELTYLRIVQQQSLFVSPITVSPSALKSISQHHSPHPPQSPHNSQSPSPSLTQSSSLNPSSSSSSSNSLSLSLPPAPLQQSTSLPSPYSLQAKLFSTLSLPEFVCISTKWHKKWKHYMRKDSTSPAPGPIDNTSLLPKSGQLAKPLSTPKHFRIIHRAVWNVLVTIYGGGPVVDVSMLLPQMQKA